MAQRRMFSLKVVDTDMFLDMSPTAQNLYFHLAMRADDDGFISNPKKISKMVSPSDDDLKMLVAKEFVIPFQSGVIVIRHWKENNYIPSDRKHDTIYKDEKSLLKEDHSGVYKLDTNCIQKGSNTDLRLENENLKSQDGLSNEPFNSSLESDCIQNVYKVYPEVRLGKDRIGKDSLGEVNKSGPEAPSGDSTTGLINAAQWHLLIDGFKPVNPMFVNLYKFKTERNALESMVKQLGLDTVLKHIASLEAVCSLPFAPKITKPTELEKQLGKLIIFEKQLNGNNNKLTNKNAAIENKYSNIKNN